MGGCLENGDYQLRERDSRLSKHAQSLSDVRVMILSNPEFFFSEDPRVRSLNHLKSNVCRFIVLCSRELGPRYAPLKLLHIG